MNEFTCMLEMFDSYETDKPLISLDQYLVVEKIYKLQEKTKLLTEIGNFFISSYLMYFISLFQD